MTFAEACAVLGVGLDAGPDEAKAAFRRAALRHHPDRGGAPEDFHLVNAAWERWRAGPAEPEDEHEEFDDDVPPVVLPDGVEDVAGLYGVSRKTVERVWRDAELPQGNWQQIFQQLLSGKARKKKKKRKTESDEF